ncbi:hypothetical protein BDW66DRAFT_158558 [Aspergillus desertorum]
MVSLQAARSHNTSLRSLGAGLVAVRRNIRYILSTALSLARHITSPKIYLIERSKPAAETAIRSIKALNPSAEPIFVQSDISLLKNVDRVCERIITREKYARMRFVNQLLPLLTSAASLPSSGPRPGLGLEEPRLGLSRVISGLDPLVSVRPFGLGAASLDYEDPSLNQSFTLRKCEHHASLMTNFYLDGMAQWHQDTSFIHAYPSGVDTGILRGLPEGQIARRLLSVLLRPSMVPIDESGERHLLAATSGRFPGAARARGEEDSRGEADADVGLGSDICQEYEQIRLRRQEGVVERVVEHTEGMFRRVCRDD